MDAPTNRQLLDPTRWPAQPAPLAWVAVGLCLGIAIDRLQALPAALWLASFVACGVGLAVALRARARWASLAIVAAAASAGAVLHQVHYRRVEARHIVRYCASQPILARLQGTVLGPVRVSQPRPTFGRWMPRPAQTRFRLAVRQIESRTGPTPATGLVQVRISEPLLVLHPGQEVEAFGRLYRLPAPDNPGEFDWRRLQRRRAVLAGLSCNSARSVRVIRGQPASLWRRLRAALRCRASEYLLGGVQPDDTPTCSLLEAMLLGQRSAVQRSINDAFVRTGAAHFLSVSGIHVGFVAIFGWMLARLVGLTRRGSAGLVALLVILYVVVAEPRPPILRAGVMALLACAAISLGRPFNSANWIGAAAIVILAARPAELFLAGFQLSFGVVLAVIHLSPRVRQVLFRISPEVERLRPRPVQLSAVRQATSWLCQKLDWALAVAVAAWLVGAPLTAYHFGRWSPLGALNSLLIAPLVFVLMIA
ncbi:MAG: ComEC/Rec2 family competence protein, partial [Phycisphaerae bacterium]